MKNSCEIKEKQYEVLKKRKDCWKVDGAGLVSGPMNNFSSDTGAILQIDASDGLQSAFVNFFAVLCGPF